MDRNLQQHLLELELDILALEIDLSLQLVKSIPPAPSPTLAIAPSHLWLMQALPTVLLDEAAIETPSALWPPRSRSQTL
ncbi:hypothetical protein [Synechococcus sp. PCC 7336]|uniref:hypothetical protein n=1 Tax=Synechococcus sp. PCC 7336 TaxID=195250 RepID=UPI00034A22F9|nr:hypothetical protein [Synechococcus sp. PCC 7336]